MNFDFNAIYSSDFWGYIAIFAIFSGAIFAVALWAKKSYLNLRGALLILAAFALVFIGTIRINTSQQAVDDAFDWVQTDPSYIILATFGAFFLITAIFGLGLAVMWTETNSARFIITGVADATERLFKVDKKGEPVVEIRLAAIYALRRIATDNKQTRAQIRIILAVYVENNMNAKNARRDDIELARETIDWCDSEL